MREMKNSSLLWVDDIPIDWSYRPLKAIFNFGKGLSITKANLVDKGVPVISYGQIHAKYNTGVSVCNELLRFVNKEDTADSSKVNKNDMIFADTSEDLEGCGNSVYVDTDYPVYGGYHTIILTSKSTVSNKYLAYLFKTDAWRFQIRRQLTDVKLYSISQKVLKNTTVILPSEGEQAKIVAFLDDRCAKIDASIQKCKDINDKLDEYKKAVMTKAVTKGVKGERDMVESGIKWIKIIPKGWSYKPLKAIFYFGKGLSITKANLVDKGVPVISYGQIHAKYNTGVSVCNELLRFVNKEDTADSSKVNKNDMIFADTSEDLEGCGNSVYVDTDYPVYGGYHTIILTSKSTVSNKYLAYLVKTDVWRFQIRRQLTEVKLYSVSQKVLKDTTVILPSEDEQTEIVAFLDKRCAEIDSAKAKNEAIIKKLEEYKKSLIYNAVTGKIEC